MKGQPTICARCLSRDWQATGSHRTIRQYRILAQLRCRVCQYVWHSGRPEAMQARDAVLEQRESA
jgi:hypothetical protein